MSTTFDQLNNRISTLEALMRELVEKKPPTQVVKKTTTNKDGSERKKRALSAYQLYCNTNRAQIQSMLVDAAGEGVKLVRGAALSELARRWNTLGEAEKKAWSDRRSETSDEEQEPVLVPEPEPEPEPVPVNEPEVPMEYEDVEPKVKPVKKANVEKKAKKPVQIIDDE
jgi:hypothetical protein